MTTEYDDIKLLIKRVITHSLFSCSATLYFEFALLLLFLLKHLGKSSSILFESFLEFVMLLLLDFLDLELVEIVIKQSSLGLIGGVLNSILFSLTAMLLLLTLQILLGFLLTDSLHCVNTI